MFKSAAHEGFVKSMVPVTGRGVFGPLPETYEGLGNPLNMPFLGGIYSKPLNIEAEIHFGQLLASTDENIRTAAKNKQEMAQPTMYTSLEKLLYGLLQALNISPYRVYAQYSAGPTLDYQLDAAIPELGIGIEADGAIWHNNFEKIHKDKLRDSELANNGWVVVRFTDEQLKDKPDQCMSLLIKVIKMRAGQMNGSVESGSEITL
jgi:very-short-patch-repair endonuclease